ncbi:MAG: glycosyltransferase family 39 protein [Alphaproteobacteria bacterium]|nr:glycosyltransferase family 39 protein [Alphaproteobacteria bacterium]MCB9798030.1 glycosyltransferase family 39 protein [Alphaproteobacteria bacterium]
MTPPAATPLLPPPGSAGRRRLWMLLALALVSRLLLLPETPFDVDAVLLTRGVVDFDPTAMRPHPPGYPGVIALALALPVEPSLALRLVSALAALPLVLGTWGLTRRLGGDALLAGALVAANPVAWFYGITENAYALGAAGAVCTSWAALVARERRDLRSAVVLGLAYGLTGAARPSLLLFLAPMVAWATPPRLWGALALGAAGPSAAWLAWCAQVSGGLGTYLSAVHTQFTWIRLGQIPHWRLHQVHHLLVYAAQGVAGAALLLPWARRVEGGRLLLLQALPALAFYLVVYVAKPGYLLAFVPTLIAWVACGRAPRPLRFAAVAVSVAWFLLPRPINVELDPTPKRPFAEKTTADVLASEASFFAMTTLGRTRVQDEANLAYARLLSPLVQPGYTTLLWQDRWDAALAEHFLPAAQVVDTRTPRLGVPVSGARLVVLGWTEPEAAGFRLIQDAEGYGAWVRELDVADLPLTVGHLALEPAY